MLSLQPKKAIETEVLVQCYRCQDSFTIGATIVGSRILRFDPHPHVIKRDSKKHNRTKCHCGGDLKFITTLS